MAYHPKQEEFKVRNYRIEESRLSAPYYSIGLKSSILSSDSIISI